MRWNLVVPGCAWLLASCVPQSRLPATYFAEDGNVLALGHVAITGVGGGGMTSSGNAVGGGGRIRVGVGGDQELGVEAAGLWIDSQDACVSTIDCSGVRHTALTSATGLVSYKRQLEPQLALLLGAGATVGGLAAWRSINATLGFVRSWRPSESVSFYAGGRLAVAFPIEADPKGTSGPVGSVTGPIGLAFDLQDPMRFYIEAGPQIAAMSGENGGGSLGFVALVGVELRANDR
jgi:hypothetical protein